MAEEVNNNVEENSNTDLNKESQKTEQKEQDNKQEENNLSKTEKAIEKLQKRMNKTTAEKHNAEEQLSKAKQTIEKLQKSKEEEAMTAEERATKSLKDKDATIEQLQKKISRQEALTDARKTFDEAGVKVDSKLLNMAVVDDKEQTLENISSLLQYSNDLSNEVKKSYYKGTTPTNRVGQTTITKEQIMAVKDTNKRLALIAQHKDLF